MASKYPQYPPCPQYPRSRYLSSTPLNVWNERSTQASSSEPSRIPSPSNRVRDEPSGTLFYLLTTGQKPPFCHPPAVTGHPHSTIFTFSGIDRLCALVLWIAAICEVWLNRNNHSVDAVHRQRPLAWPLLCRRTPLLLSHV